LKKAPEMLERRLVQISLGLARYFVITSAPLKCHRQSETLQNPAGKKSSAGADQRQLLINAEINKEFFLNIICFTIFPAVPPQRMNFFPAGFLSNLCHEKNEYLCSLAPLPQRGKPLWDWIEGDDVIIGPA
jgi:hypothetical protein